jgi:hypothetical protein
MRILQAVGPGVRPPARAVLLRASASFQPHPTMDKIVRREFRGNWLLFWVLCLTVIGLPLALLYLLNGTVEIHSECKDAETTIEKIRTRR